MSDIEQCALPGCAEAVKGDCNHCNKGYCCNDHLQRDHQSVGAPVPGGDDDESSSSSSSGSMRRNPASRRSVFPRRSTMFGSAPDAPEPQLTSAERETLRSNNASFFPSELWDRYVRLYQNKVILWIGDVATPGNAVVFVAPIDGQRPASGGWTSAQVLDSLTAAQANDTLKVYALPTGRSAPIFTEIQPDASVVARMWSHQFLDDAKNRKTYLNVQLQKFSWDQQDMEFTENMLLLLIVPPTKRPSGAFGFSPSALSKPENASFRAELQRTVNGDAALKSQFTAMMDDARKHQFKRTERIFGVIDTQEPVFDRTLYPVVFALQADSNRFVPYTIGGDPNRFVWPSFDNEYAIVQEPFKTKTTVVSEPLAAAAVADAIDMTVHNGTVPRNPFKGRK